jgi:non-homologous end joining protein Ku
MEGGASGRHKALKGGLMLSILRYAMKLRDPKSYFERINFEPKSEAVGLAKELIEARAETSSLRRCPTNMLNLA